MPGPAGPAAPDGPSGSGGPNGPGNHRDIEGLPRRVRQASLAPQLRANPPQRATSAAASAGPASGPTPAEIRQTMSALQRGWQEGRKDTEPAADESRGQSDGT